MENEKIQKYGIIYSIVALIIISAGIAFSQYMEHIKCIKAMENGYTQQVVSGNTIWVKQDK